MSDIKWIKIDVDIFDDEKIKLIEKLPEGDKILIIWIKLLVMAGKKNDYGQIYIIKNIALTPDMLSDIMGRNSKIVSLALNTFKSFGMIEIYDNYIEIVNWEKHQNVKGMERTKKLRQARNKRYYENKKEVEIKTSYRRQQCMTDKIRIDKNRIDKKKYAEYVFMTEKEYNTLIERYGKEKTTLMIEKLDNYKGSKGKKYKSDYRAILTWVVETVKTKGDYQALDGYLENI